MVEGAVEGHHPDGVGEELGVGCAQLGAVGEPEEVERLAAEGEADPLHVPRHAHRVEVAEERPGQPEAALAHGLRVGTQVRKPRLVRGKERDVVVPDVGVAADGRTGPGAAWVHADHVEAVEHRRGEDRRAARLQRHDGRRGAARPARVEDQAADALGRVPGRQAVEPDRDLLAVRVGVVQRDPQRRAFEAGIGRRASPESPVARRRRRARCPRQPGDRRLGARVANPTGTARQDKAARATDRPHRA